MIEPKKIKTNTELWEEVYEDTLTEQREPELKIGIEDLDRKVFGLHRGEVVLIDAFPKSGKTSLALNIAHNVSDSAKRVDFFSFEMSRKRLMRRLISIIARVEAGNILKHTLSEEDKIAIIKGKEIISDLNLNLHYGIVKTREGLLEFCAKNKPDVVIVDYIQKIKWTGGYSRVEAIEQWINTFTDCATTYNFAGIVCSQSTQSEGFGNKKKILSETGKWSRSLEEAVDSVWKLQWEEEKKEYRIHITENRDGEIGSVQMRFIPNMFLFTNI